MAELAYRKPVLDVGDWVRIRSGAFEGAIVRISDRGVNSRGDYSYRAKSGLNPETLSIHYCSRDEFGDPVSWLQLMWYKLFGGR